MDKEQVEQFCSEWLASWTGNDPKKLIQFYEKDAFYRDPSKPQGLKGHDEILPYFKKLLAANPNWKWEIVEIFLHHNNGFTLKWKATIPTSSKIVTEFGLDILETKNGKITRNEVFFNTIALQKTTR